MTEALALALAVAVALLLPVDGNRSVAAVLLESIIGFLRAQAFVLSVV